MPAVMWTGQFAAQRRKRRSRQTDREAARAAGAIARQSARSRNTYQKSADRRGNLEALRQAGHQQYGSKDGEQNDFVGLMRRQPADPVTVPHRSHRTPTTTMAM